MFELKNFADNIAHCIQCGFCQSVCPVFAEEKIASMAARGKISLVQALMEGDLAVNKRFADRLFTCLLCTSCVGACPSGVKIDDILIAARGEVVRQKGLRVTKKAAFHLLEHQGSLAKTLKILSRVNQAVSRSPWKNLLPRAGPFLSLLLSSRGRFLDPPLETATMPEPRLRVGYFTGCATNLVNHPVGWSVLKVLRENGIEVIIPPTQQCCGLPQMIHGDIGTAQKLIRHNVEVFHRAAVEAVIIDCPSCALVMKEKSLVLLQDEPPPILAKAREVSRKVQDIMEFLAGLPQLRPYAAAVGTTATYHVPCHAGLELETATRRLLPAVPGIQLVEMEDPGKCCGAGGLFFLTNGGIAARIREHKLTAIRHTGAGVVVTGCPACRMYLTQGLQMRHMSQQVVHPVELLARAYRKNPADGR